MTAFIDDYLWEIPMFPRTGVEYNKYTISDIYYYNSEQSKDYNSPKQNIQIGRASCRERVSDTV